MENIWHSVHGHSSPPQKKKKKKTKKSATIPLYNWKQNIGIVQLILTGYQKWDFAQNVDTHRKIVFHHVSQLAFCFAGLELAWSLDEKCFMLKKKVLNLGQCMYT